MRRGVATRLLLVLVVKSTSDGRVVRRSSSLGRAGVTQDVVSLVGRLLKLNTLLSSHLGHGVRGDNHLAALRSRLTTRPDHHVCNWIVVLAGE